MKLAYLLPSIMLFSCIKQDANIDVKQNCGLNYTESFSINNYNEFLDLDGFSKDPDVFYRTGYSIADPKYNPGSMYWWTTIVFKNICNTDLPYIEFSAKFLKPVANITVESTIQEDNLYQTIRSKHLTAKDTMNFSDNVNFHFSGGFKGSKTIYAGITFFATTKGSYDADRDYFFSILSSMSCTIKAHKPQ
jgi:hypothetical protein